MRISDWSSDVCSSDLLCVTHKWASANEEGGVRPFVGFPGFVRNRIATGCDHVCQRCLAGTAGPDDRHQARIERYGRRLHPWRIENLDPGNHLRRRCRRWRLAPDMRPVARVDTCLPQRVEFEPTLDPGEAVPERRSNTLEVVCVASMQARLQATVHFKIGRASCRDRVCKYV